MIQEVLEDVENLGAKAATTNAAALSDDELCEAAVRLRKARRSYEATELAILGELDARGATDIEHGHRTTPWLKSQVREPHHECRDTIAVARACRTLLGETHLALTQGAISYAHARAITKALNPRIEADLADLQPALISRAKEINYAQWQNELHALVALLDQDGSYDPAREQERTKATVLPLFDGSTQLHAQLYGDDALCVSEAIRMEADSLYLQHRRDKEADPDIPSPGRGYFEAKALVSLCRKGIARDTGSSQPARPEAVIIVDPTKPDTALLSSGTVVTAAAIGRLLSDPNWQMIISDPTSGRIDITPTRRFASPEQRKALAVRDGGCIFPGCDHPAAWTEAHHVIPFGEGGETVLSNLASLCRHHHGVTHRNGWRMQPTHHPDGTPTGSFIWLTPAGRTIYSQRHGMATHPA